MLGATVEYKRGSMDSRIFSRIARMISLPVAFASIRGHHALED